MFNFIKYLVVLFIISACACLIGCGAGVTETGNPPGYSGQETASLVNSLCDTLSDCYEVSSAEDCAEALQNSADTMAAFGVDTGTYADFDAVQVDIDGGTLSIDETALNDCLNALDSVACATIGEEGAYDEASPADYGSLYKIIPAAECGGLF